MLSLELVYCFKDVELFFFLDFIFCNFICILDFVLLFFLIMENFLFLLVVVVVIFF